MVKHPPKKPINEQEKPAQVTSGEQEPMAEPPLEPVVETSTTGPASKLSVDDIQALGDGEIELTLKALRAEVRRREGEREASRPRVGSKVRILRGRPKYIGKVGTAVIVRRSRCFVSVPELTSPAYALITDLELLER